MIKVPLLDLSLQNQPLKAAFEKKFSEIVDTNAFILGPEVQALEAEIAKYTQTAYAVGMSSGTDALLVALMALGIEPGDEVLCPAFTFFGTAGSIARLGAIPVWVDALEDTYNIDLGDARKKLTSKTKAIIPVHLFGQACDMECLMAFAQEHNLKVVEDAAQSLGAAFKDKPVGSIGDIGIYSFYPTKNLGALGDGGMLVTQNAELADKCIWLRNHGMNPKYYHKYVGGNFRLDGIQAAFLRIKLNVLESYHEGRSKHAEFYLEKLAGNSAVILPVVRDEMRMVWNQFTLRVPNGRRDELKEFLTQRNIGSEIYYPLSLDQQECFQGNSKGGETIKVANALSNEVLSIPVFPEMTIEQRDAVVQAIWDFGYPKG